SLPNRAREPVAIPDRSALGRAGQQSRTNTLPRVSACRCPSIPEHNCLVSVHDNAAVEVPGYCPGEDSLLDVLAFACEIFRGILMADPLHVLLDDRAFIQICRHVVRG